MAGVCGTWQMGPIVRSTTVTTDGASTRKTIVRRSSYTPAVTSARKGQTS